MIRHQETATLARSSHIIRSGAIAGVIAVVVFTVAHHLFTSNIWFSLPLMALVGASCGMYLGWSYTLLTPSASLRRWLAYNLFYDGAFLLLALTSVLVFEPVITMAALIADGPPPPELTAQALPLTAFFTVFTAAVGTLIFGARSLTQVGAMLLSTVLLMLFLGMNVAIIGLVDIPAAGWAVVAEFFAYILLLNAVFAAVFALLERPTFVSQRGANL